MLVNLDLLERVTSQDHGKSKIDVHKFARETMLDLFGLKPTSTIQEHDYLDGKFQEALYGSVEDPEQLRNEMKAASSDLQDLLDGFTVATKTNVRKAVEKIYIVGLGLRENATRKQIKDAIAAKLK